MNVTTNTVLKNIILLIHVNAEINYILTRSSLSLLSKHSNEKKGWCTLPNGDTKPPLAVWRGQQCPEMCQCIDGETNCSPVHCPALVCGHGQKLISNPEGRCCSDCQRDTGLCFAEGIVKQVTNCTIKIYHAILIY